MLGRPQPWRRRVGLDPVSGAGRDERGGDDIAAHAHLKESPGNPEPASAGFVANVEVGELAVLAFSDAAHSSLQGVLGGGDAAVVTRLGITIGFEDGDDSFFFMDVESDVEFARCV